MDAKATGRFLAELRKKKGFTQKELAAKLNVTDKAISRWETGKGLPETALLNPLADLLGGSVGELLAGQHIKPEQMRQQTDRIILESLAYSEEDRVLKRILCFIGLGILVAIGGLFFALVMDVGFSTVRRISALALGCTCASSL